MIKKLIYLTIGFSACCSVSACNDDDNNVAPLPIEYKVSTDKMLFLKGASSDVFYVEASQQPSVTISGADWVSVSTPVYNNDSHRVYAVTVTVTENPGYDNRECQLTVNAGSSTSQVTVIQASADGIAVADASANVAANGGEFSVLVRATGTYSIDAPEWITIKSSRAMSEYTSTFVAQTNVTGAARQGTITFTLDADPAQTATVTVNQAAASQTTGKTALQAAADIYAGWNLGNTLEATGGETAWGNPMTSKALIDGVKAAGFNAVRIPCSWNQYLVADAEPYTIDADWMNRVKEVVNYVVSNDMYAILNIHWDGGWLEQHANAASKDAVCVKEAYIWKQIATAFESYGDKLIFAGNNEIRDEDNWGMPNAGNIEAVTAFNQTFIDAVRATGGNNATRNLVVQSWCCNPWRAMDSFTMPTDPADGHLMVEVHFYDPFSFTHDGAATTGWGYRKGYVSNNSEQEDYIDDLFGKIKATFVDKGYPVILGEYGTNCHSTTDETLKACDAYYLEYVTMAAKNNGMVPFYWDNGAPQANSFGLFVRSTGKVGNANMCDGIMRGAAAGHYPF